MFIYLSATGFLTRADKKKHAYAELPTSEKHASQEENVRTSMRNSAFPRALYIIALFDHFTARSGQIVAIVSDLDDPDIIIMIIYILQKHNNNKKCFKNELNSQFWARSGDWVQPVNTRTAIGTTGTGIHEIV